MKPDGLFVITPKMGPAFVEALPVGKFHGVGPATTAKMNRLGIENGLDLRAQTISFLQQHFGKSGPYFYWIARGVDDRPVRANRIRKSVGAENTFFIDLFTFDAAQNALLPIIDKVWRHCESTGARGRTVTLKVKYTDFQQITRSRSLPRRLKKEPHWSGSRRIYSGGSSRSQRESGSSAYLCPHSYLLVQSTNNSRSASDRL
jgi:DNA polymerase-4